MQHTVTEDFWVRKTEWENRYSIDVYKLWELVERWLYKGLKIERPEQEIQDALMRIALDNELTRANVLDLLLEELWIENYWIWNDSNKFDSWLDFDD